MLVDKDIQMLVDTLNELRTQIPEENRELVAWEMARQIKKVTKPFNEQAFLSNAGINWV